VSDMNSALPVSRPATNPGMPGQPYSIKRDGLTITNCDSEPVQTPGCIQAHGAVLVLRLSDLTILQASDNAQAVLGQAAQQLLGHPISTVLEVDGQDRLRRLLDQETAECNPLYLLTLPARADSDVVLDVTVHMVDGVVILEFESSGRSTASMPDYYSLVKTTVGKLQSAGSLQQFCDIVTHEIRELTGMDRVMVYKFHADNHGEVVAESKRADLSPWLGLHYPAEDIPKPAREIFRRTWIRPVPDVSDALAEMVPLANPDTGKPLNMTYCVLRGVSMMYSEYLRNMGVAAALTMAIRHNDQLWGLIACHHYAGPKRVSYQIRAACEFLAQVVSLQHQAAADKEHFAYRLKLEGAQQVLLAAAAREGGLAGLIHGSPSLLDGIDCGGAALYYLDRWWRVGNTPSEKELDGLGDWLNDSIFPSAPRPLYASDRLANAYPPASAFSSVASGLLAIPVSPVGGDLVLWFRPETIHTVKWGGNPHDKPTVPGPNGPRLTPRHSFEMFVESVKQQSLPWKQAELEAAAGMRVLIAELRAKRADRVVVQADLIRSNDELDAFAYVASHDLKEPLRGIHRYAHQLLDDAVPGNDEQRHKLSSLLSLTSRMESLLDSMLHFSRVGGSELVLEAVNLNDVLAEAIDFIGSRADAPGAKVVVPRRLPMVTCDWMRCRQIFVNLLTNAFKYSNAEHKRVEIGYIGATEAHARPGCPPASAGEDIFYVADNGIGIDVKHYRRIFKLFNRLNAHDSYGGGAGAGLTIVRKLVEQHGGEIWLDSQLGQGTTFFFTLPQKVTES
jgi:chemotaxis family two-component system sensor kinase Cph1